MNGEGTGTINLWEYLVLLEHCCPKSANDMQTMSPMVHDDDLRGAFSMLDETGQGYVSIKTLREKMHKTFGTTYLNQVIHAAGVHDDGCVTYAEFMRMFVPLPLGVEIDPVVFNGSA